MRITIANIQCIIIFKAGTQSTSIKQKKKQTDDNTKLSFQRTKINCSVIETN